MRRLAGLFIYVAVALYLTYSAHLMFVNSGSKAHEPKKTRKYVFGEKIAVSVTPAGPEALTGRRPSPIPTYTPTPSPKPTFTPTLTPTPTPTSVLAKEEQ